MRPKYQVLFIVAVVLVAALVAIGTRAAEQRPAAQLAPPQIVEVPSAVSTGSVPTTEPPHWEPFVYAVIGDYGAGSDDERRVADMVASWRPAFILTNGDDHYDSAGGIGTTRYWRSTGLFYGPWLANTAVASAGESTGGARTNAFFPTLGNHDYEGMSAASYLDYFDLPGAGMVSTSGNERYYDFVRGPVHFFALNSGEEEPDGNSADSKQAAWLKAALADSRSRWNIVYFHHAPYSSDEAHGSFTPMQWPFRTWGADVVLSGHAHDYERVMADGIAYMVNGSGGGVRRGFSKVVPGSVVRYSDDWGAQKVTVSGDTMTFEFYSLSGGLIDKYVVTAKR